MVRGVVDSNVPTITTPVGYVTIDGKRYPVEIEKQHRRVIETLWERSGGFEDEVFDNDAIASDLGSRITDAVERLEALESSGQEVSDLLSALEELRQRIDAIESLPSVAEPIDAERLVAEAIAAAKNVVEEAEFNRPAPPSGELAELDNITLARVTDAGLLAAQDTIDANDLGAGLGFIERGSGPPTADSARVYQDTADGGVYSDDGTTVVRLSPTFTEARLGTNTDVSSTTFQVVAQAALGTRLASALVWVSEVFDAFQAPDAATDATFEGQWVLYLSDTSQTLGLDPSSGGANITPLWTGSVGGLTFTTAFGSIVVATNDLGQEIYATPKTLGTEYAGAPAYLQLCLKRTAGAGAAKLSSALGFDSFAVMG